MENNNSKEAAINGELTPVAPLEQRLSRAVYLESERTSQAWDAWKFRLTGKSEGTPPYGKEYDRDYNPIPYPEAKPDIEEYMHTGIGAVYGYPSSEYWQLAGWNIVRTNAEVRKRRKW